MVHRKLFLIIQLLLAFQFSYGQHSSKKNTIVGTWRIVEFSSLDSSTGQWVHPFGKNPKGYFIYTKNNIVNINVCSEFPLKISEDSSKNYTINLFNHIWNNSFGYFGTYSIDSKNSVVTHHVEGGSIPYYIEKDKKRAFNIKGDTLTIGDNKTWKRVLVRVE
jgi:hypothetical protein